MARGFGTTFGSGTTDKIATSTTTYSSTKSYAIWTYRNVNDATSRRMWDNGNGRSFSSGVAGEYRFNWDFSTSGGQWAFVRPALSEWHHIGWSFDDSSDTNAPLGYLDGVSQSISPIVDNVGTALTTGAEYLIGNSAAGTNNWDGSLAEFGYWNVILSADEFLALAKGVSPLLIRPTALIEYVPLIGPANSYVNGATTVTGTAIQPHPLMHYPARRRRYLTSAAVAGARPALVGGKLTNSLLLGGLAR